jgi:Flp pilus assembly protein TadG
MPSRINLVLLLACAFRRLRRDRSGSAAIEFAIVAPLFLIGVIGIVEIAFTFLATQMLENATQDATRSIMTGQVKATTTTKDAFRGMVCDKVKLLLDCGNLYVDAQAFAAMPDPSTFANPVQNQQFVDSTQFITGKAGDIVVVRTFYAWPVYLTKFLYGYDMSNIDGGKRVLSSAAAVRNEPFP